jgi:hypothetical protein
MADPADIPPADWQSCQDPAAMLRWAGARMSARKQRLFACACCRRVAFMVDAWAYDFRRDDYRRALETAEQFADGAATVRELADAHSGADDSTFINQDLDYAERDGGVDPFRDVASAEPAVVMDIWQQVLILVREFGTDPNPTGARRRHDAEERTERAAQADLLRDLLVSSLPACAFDPGWRTWRDGLLVSLARRMYDNRNFTDMPVLANALQEAGCTDTAILEHCRRPAAHVRGCWALDLLLDKG